MPATPTNPTTRFFQPEVSKVYFLPAIAATNLTPLRAEVNAGLDLSAEIAALSGWTVTSGQIETPDLGTRFTATRVSLTV